MKANKQKIRNKTKPLPHEENDVPECREKDMETALAALQAEVIARTRQLQVIMENAERSQRMNSEFFAHMSREIRTPMNGVIGMAQLMLESNLDAGQRTFAQTISQTGLSLLESVNNVLECSVAEAETAKTPAQPATDAHACAPLIDVNYVNRMKTDFQEGPFRSLLQQYLSDVEQALSDLGHAVEKQDFTGIQNLLHLLKGCSANFGASAIAGFCEDHATHRKRQGKMTGSDIVKLRQIYEATRERLLEIAG